MSVSAALAEAWASNDVSGDLLYTLEIDHISFETPLRFVQGTRVPELYETVSLPVAGNPAAVFTVVDFSWQRPGQEEGGVTKARIRIDNVSRQIQEALKAAVSADTPFSVIYREYSSKDPNHPEVFDGLRMRSANLTATSATGELGYEEIELKGFPARTYSSDLYSALYGQ
jgi:hypothetical protein